MMAVIHCIIRVFTLFRTFLNLNCCHAHGNGWRDFELKTDKFLF